MANTLIGRQRGLHVATFLGGSVLCAAINNAILIAGDWLNFHYVVLLVICYFTSSSVGYVYHCRITFDQPMNNRGYFNFVTGIWFGLPVSLALIALMVDWLGFPMWVAAPVMTIIMFLYHYLVARLAINKKVVPH
ncbi:MAG: GtrA family protein [Pseudomonadota bacterium]